VSALCVKIEEMAHQKEIEYYASSVNAVAKFIDRVVPLSSCKYRIMKDVIVPIRNFGINQDLLTRGQKMRINNVEPYVIDSESEADMYLNELFKKEKYRSIGEVQIRAELHIRDAIIKKYFIAKAEEMLQDFR
jgi:hypothetical protein